MRRAGLARPPLLAAAAAAGKDGDQVDNGHRLSMTIRLSGEEEEANWSNAGLQDWGS